VAAATTTFVVIEPARVPCRTLRSTVLMTWPPAS
jgi:hypothetical protein